MLTGGRACADRSADVDARKSMKSTQTAVTGVGGAADGERREASTLARRAARAPVAEATRSSDAAFLSGDRSRSKRASDALHGDWIQNRVSE